MRQIVELAWMGTFLQAWIISALIMFGITASARYHARWSAGPVEAIQKMHQGPVPRIGGLAIVCGIWFGLLAVGPLQIHPIILITAIASSIIFAIGFAEDLSGTISVLWRLLLTFIPGGALAYQTHLYLSHLGWAPADALLSSPWIAITFTAFALAGVTHAFNLIDGLNGLVSYTSLWILGPYLGLAYLYDDHLIMQMCLLLVAPILGFLFFNWPWGKCFLGDGGAYLLGFSLAWIGVMLVERHLSISPFAPLLICAYPVIEALYSIARRIQNKASSGAPDRSHLHHLFKMGLVKPWLKDCDLSSVKSNSIAGLSVSLLSVPFMASPSTFRTNMQC